MTVLTTELIVSDKVEFHGIAQENIIVKDSGVLILRGIACKDVIIDAASSAKNHVFKRFYDILVYLLYQKIYQ